MLQAERLVWSGIPKTESICYRCLLRLAWSQSKRWSSSATTANKETSRHNLKIQRPWRREYFSANLSFQTTREILSTSPLLKAQLQQGRLGQDDASPERLDASQEVDTVDNHPASASEPPHRRRKRLKAEAASAEQFLPSNSSSDLSDLSSKLPVASIRRLLATCLSLSKPRLSFLIVLTTAAAYSLYPVPTLLLPTTTSSPSLSALTLVFLTSGTALCSASANALNMLLEPKYDAQMSRTRNRPLVRGLISKKGAFVFATLAGGLGVGGLWFGVNPTVAFLGSLNILLYACVYTPMKRISVLNTWVGAVVGGVPPLMGWAAAAGQSATGSGDWRELLLSENSVGGWLLAGLLFAWQFPHFNSLSWPIREEYRRAGYRMLVWTNARMNGRVALRYALLSFPICFGLWRYQITDQGFLVTSSVVNAWMVREAWRFWQKEGHKGTARALFWASVWHLPVVMVLAMVHKQGLWQGIWTRLRGEAEEEKLLVTEGLTQPESRRLWPLRVSTSQRAVEGDM